MTDLPRSRFWSQIDAALVINLKHREDRWERIHQIVRRHLPEDRIIRVDAVYGMDLPGYNQPPWFRGKTTEKIAKIKAGAAGCCLSHRKAVQVAKDNGYKRVFILEDDADFHNELDTPQGDAVAEVFDDDASWDMFYLGYYQKLNKYHAVKTVTIDDKPFELRRIRGPLLTHAMVFNQRIYDALLAGLPTEKNIWHWMTYWGSVDSWIQNHFGRRPGVKVWTAEPRLVMQTTDYSDIIGRTMTIEESQGTHRKTRSIPLDARAFERSIPIPLPERLYQAYKRNTRVLKARLFGYSKS